MTLRNPDEGEAKFRSWAGGPGETALDRCENAERMVRKAISSSHELQTIEIEVFAQGSFRATINV